MWTSVQQGLAWAGIVLLVGVAAMAVGVAQPRVGTVDGVWVGRGEGGEPVSVELPGMLERQGLSADARIVVERQLELPADGIPRALLIEQPQYALAVTWDGRELARSGDPEDPEGERSDAALLVPLPEGAGPHRLGLDLRGDLGKGGVTGRMLVGPLDEVESVVRARESKRVALALVMALVAIVQLVVATRPSPRLGHLLFGVFAGGLAIWSFTFTEAAAGLFELVVRIRVRRVTMGVFPAFGLAFLGVFLHGRIPPFARAVVAVGLLTAALGLLLPEDVLYDVETAQDIVVVVVVGAFLVQCVDAALRRVRWAKTLLAAVFPPLVLAVVSEVLVSHGLLAGESLVFPATTLFAVGLSSALAMRHATEAARHERLITGSPDAIVSVGPSGQIEALNPAAGELFGPRAEGRPLRDFVLAEDAALLDVHTSTRLARVELRLTRFRGRVYESVATSLEGGAALLVLRDVTRRRELDGVVIQAARLETLGVLVGGIAHDFNNMLGTLLAQIGLLQVTSPDAPTRERLVRMESTVERASLLVRRMLTIARGTSPELVPVDLHAVVDGARELVEPTLPAGVTLVVDVPKDLPEVLGAAVDLEQVLVNLVVNARDAIGERGEIAVRARVATDGAPVVVLVVEDDGPGVPDERKSQIFQPFVSSKSPRRGSGLGLAVAARILRDHLGRLWVEDRPGGGARFLAALRVADGAREEEAPPLVHARVLLVEDEQELLDTYAGALREAGYEVRAVADGDEAARVLRDWPPAVLVTDVVLPGQSGIDLAETCHALYPDVPVLIVSGYIPEQGFARVGDWRWYRLDKPVRSTRLVAEVGRVLRRAERGRAVRDDASVDDEASIHGLTASRLGL